MNSGSSLFTFHLLVWYKDILPVLVLVERAKAFSFFLRRGIRGRGSLSGFVFGDFFSFLLDDLHLIPILIHNGKIAPGKESREVEIHHHGDHQRHGEDHGHIEKIDHHA